VKKRERGKKDGKLKKHAPEKLRALTDGIEEPIYVVDPKTYEILFVNEKSNRLFGQKIEKITEKPTSESSKFKGTTFMVTIPIEPKTEEEGGEKAWVASLESLLSTTTRT
jgi:transcriptional regulator with PAS, ATPase and Fis domain